MLRLLAVLLAVAFASPAAAATIQYRVQLSDAINMPPPPPPITSAADTLPSGFDRAGLAPELRWFDDDQHVLALLHNRTAAESAINWPDASPEGSQRLEVRFPNPVRADGCAVILQSRGAPTMPGVQFQAQRQDGTWTGWSAPAGTWDAMKSGNKTYDGACGLDGSPIVALAVRPSANGATGAIWYREFRVSFGGVSAP